MSFGNLPLVSFQSTLKETLELYRSANAGGLIIHHDKLPYQGLLDAGIIVQALRIEVPVIGILDWSFLKIFKNITELTMRENVDKPIDLNWFPCLRTVSYCPQIINMAESKVEKILCYGYCPSTHDLSSLPFPETVQELTLSHTNLKSLNGIERAQNLRRLTVHVSHSLSNISALNGLKELESIEFAYTPKVEMENLNNLPNLNRLWLMRSKIKSIELNLCILNITPP